MNTNNTLTKDQKSALIARLTSGKNVEKMIEKAMFTDYYQKSICGTCNHKMKVETDVTISKCNKCGKPSYSLFYLYGII